MSSSNHVYLALQIVKEEIEDKRKKVITPISAYDRGYADALGELLEWLEDCIVKGSQP